MWSRRLTLRMLLAIALTPIWGLPAVALVDCRVPLHDDSFTVDIETLHVVPDTLLPDAFNAVFDLYVNWEWGGENPWWPDSCAVALAKLIMPDLAAGIGPEDSYAHRTAQFFGVDSDTSYAGIHFGYWRKGVRHEQSHFGLVLHQVSSSALPSGWIYLGIKDRGLEPEAVAKDHFAHEWGHMCDYSSGASLLNGFPGFGDKWQYFEHTQDTPTYYTSGTEEFMAKSSEYYNGQVSEAWYGDFLESKYSVSLGRSDWHERCQMAFGGGDTDGGSRRWAFFPFSAYLQDHFADEGLLYDWIHEVITCGLQPQDSSNTCPHDFANLAIQLEADDYAGSFAQTSGDGRLRELFREFALAMWVNSDSLFAEGDNPEASVLLPEHPGASARTNFGYFMVDYDDQGSPGGNYCQNDALCLPYYVDVTEDVKEVTGPFMGSDFGCPEQDLRNFRRELTFDTYAFGILPFRADESVLESGRCHDLEVRIVLDDAVECFYEEDTLEWEASDNDYLHFWVVGYPEHRDSLDIYGAEAVLIDDAAYTDFAVGDTLAFTVPCFGSAYKAVTLVVSLTELEPSSGTAEAHVIPYHYVCWAADKSGDQTISADTTWEAEEGPFCLGGEVTVSSGKKLTIEPGTTIWCADPDSVDGEVGFVVNGRLELNGTAQAAVTLKPILNNWDGFTIGNGGALLAEHLVLSGLDGLACNPTADRVQILDSDITLTASSSVTGMDFSEADTVLVEGCNVQGGATIVLGDGDQLSNVEIHQRSGAGWTAIQLDGDATLDDVLIYSASTAVKCLSGNPELENVSANSTVSCQMAVTSGLRAVGTADVTVSNCTFDGFCRAIRLDDSAQAYVRQTRVNDAGDIGIYVGGKNARADFGYIINPPVAGMYGDDCIDTADPNDYRVYSRSKYVCMAEGNYWGTDSPTSSLFYGNVAWADSILEECPGGSGGPGLSIIAAPLALVDPLHLGPPVPNPFNPSCELRFTLPATGASSSLAIYDLSGRRLATLFSGRADGREHSLRWDGRDAEGRAMSSGVYFARLQIGAESQSRKLVVVK